MSDIDHLVSRLTVRQQREYALKCARRVERLMTDQRSVAALDTRERRLRGEATDEEMAAASWAATAAARDAAWAAARAAAGTAARAAARAAAGTAARAAARSAARAAAWDAERAWQRGELERMLKEGGGACGG